MVIPVNGFNPQLKMDLARRFSDIKLKHSVSLPENDNLPFEKNIEMVRKTLSRRTSLDENLISFQKGLATARERFRVAENEEVTVWFTDINALKDTLRSYENAEKEEVIKTVKEGEVAYEKQKQLVEELASHQGRVDDVLARGESIMSSKKCNQSKCNEIAQEMKVILQRWKSLKDRTDVLDGYKSIIDDLKVAVEEKGARLLIQVGSFNEWLLNVKQKLKNWNKASSFVKYIQKNIETSPSNLNQPLIGPMMTYLVSAWKDTEKLSEERKSRAKEFVYLVKNLSEVIPQKTGMLSARNNSLFESLMTLNVEWNLLIDSIEADFEHLYKAIKTLLDLKCGHVEKTIQMMKTNTISIEQKCEDQDAMRTSAKKLVQLNNDIIKLKRSVSKLIKLTSDLIDDGFFKECLEEKDLLLESVDKFDKQQKECEDKVTQCTIKFRHNVVMYVREQCYEAKTKLLDYASEISVYNTEEESLHVLKEYLIQDRQILEDVKTERLFIDAMEKLADEISANDVLTNDDEIQIEDYINQVLQAFDQLRNQIKEGTNKVYIVAINIYSYQQQKLAEELDLIKADIRLKMRQILDVKDFDQASESLSYAQNLRNRVDEISCEITLLANQVEQWMEISIMEMGDGKDLQKTCVFVKNECISVSKDLDNLLIIVQGEVRAILLKKIGDFRDWLSTVKKQKESNNVVPDLDILDKNIQDLKMVRSQAEPLSVLELLHPDRCDTLEILTKEEKDDLKSANEEWMKITNWIEIRISVLQRTKDIWVDFKCKKSELQEYIRDTETELNLVVGIDLNDTTTVGLRQAACQTVISGMETRKNRMASLSEVAEELITTISSDVNKEKLYSVTIDTLGNDTLGNDKVHSVTNNIRTQLAVIQDSWNSTLKRSIEMKIKLQTLTRKFKTLEKMFLKAREWISDCNNLLGTFSTDTGGEHIAQIQVELEEKNKQEVEIKELIEEINELDYQLSKDEVICPQYTLAGSAEEVSNDFSAACKQLEDLKKFGGKVRILSRRVRRSFSNEVILTTGKMEALAAS